MTESSGLPPEQEAVRRLLGEARHDGPPPPDVVARLDATLASLAAERSTAAEVDPSPGRVVDIGSRRRRLAGVGLLAAASVVVAGVALGQVLPRGGDADESSAGSASDTSVAEGPTSSDDGGGATEGDSGSSDDLTESGRAPQPEESFLTPGLAGLPSVLSSDDDLDEALLDLRTESRGQAADGSVRARLGCGVPGIGQGRRVAAKIDGQPGLVVYRPPVGEAQRADLYVCGDPQPVRTLTLPAP